jgi:cell division protein FtsL
MARAGTVKIAEHTGIRYSSFIWIALMLMVVALLYVWCHINITGLNYDIAEEVKFRDRLVKENSELKMEIQMLKSPGRVEAFARDHLGMHYPEKDQVIVIK